MNKIIVICGPTAVGKTDFALSIAPQFSGEIISADSRQIYQGMDIGTGKDIPVGSAFHVEKTNDINGTSCAVGYYPVNASKIWLTDIINPRSTFGSGIYQQLASELIHDLDKKNVTPIIVGGTGFYIQSLIHPSETQRIPPNEKLRQELNQQSVAELQNQLQKLNTHRWQAMNHSDQCNPHRLIRAIEVLFSSASLPPCLPAYEAVSIGLTAPVDILIERIKARVSKRIEDGFTDEVQRLLNANSDFPDTPGKTMGYQEWIQFLNGSISQDEAIVVWTKREIDYMKRQQTWFKKQPLITWFDITSKNWYAEAVNQLETEWNNV